MVSCSMSSMHSITIVISTKSFIAISAVKNRKRDKPKLNIYSMIDLSLECCPAYYQANFHRSIRYFHC